MKCPRCGFEAVMFEHMRVHLVGSHNGDLEGVIAAMLYDQEYKEFEQKYGSNKNVSDSDNRNKYISDSEI